MAITIAVGPLPTTFTPEKSCTELTLANRGNQQQLGQTTDQYVFQYARECKESGALALQANCLPSRYAAAFENMDPNQKEDVVYPVLSPGIACPVGYQPACTMVQSTSTARSGLSTWGLLSKGETAIGCCPTGYECDPQISYLCYSAAKVGATVSGDMVNVCGTKITERTKSSLVVVSTMQVLAAAPQLVYVLERDTAAAPSSTAQPGASPGGSLPTGGPSSSKDSSTSDSQELSTGAKAAIGVTVPLAALLIAALAFFLYRRKKKNVKPLDPEMEPTPPDNKPPSYVTKDGNSAFVGTAAAEIPRDGFKAELDGSVYASPDELLRTVSPELDSSTVGDRFSKAPSEYSQISSVTRFSELPMAYKNVPTQNFEPIAEMSGEGVAPAAVEMGVPVYDIPQQEA